MQRVVMLLQHDSDQFLGAGFAHTAGNRHDTQIGPTAM